MGDYRPAREVSEAVLERSPEAHRAALLAAARKVVVSFMSGSSQGQAAHELAALVRKIEGEI